MKKFNRVILPLLSLVIYKGCAPPPSSLAEGDPVLLIARADSLLAARPGDTKLKAAIVTARLSLAKTNNSLNEYKAVLNLDPKNATARYHIFIAKGKEHHNKGHKNGQWDAIQSFSKAATAIDTLGEPYYWIGLAYEKKDEMDFELPLESYDKALALYLPGNIRLKVESSRGALLKRKKTYVDFWE
ncbi:hypothetical protein JYT44_00225 [Caldithrix abyssi]|nr:hypothetical protein [Caldithrix abyssi]